MKASLIVFNGEFPAALKAVDKNGKRMGTVITLFEIDLSRSNEEIAHEVLIAALAATREALMANEKAGHEPW